MRKKKEWRKKFGEVRERRLGERKEYSHRLTTTGKKEKGNNRQEGKGGSFG